MNNIDESMLTMLSERVQKLIHQEQLSPTDCKIRGKF